MIRTTPILFALALALTLASSQVIARASDDAMAPTDKAANALYWEAQSALRGADWTTALERFTRLEAQLREREPANADSAMYWRAYTLVKARRGAEARTVVERLHREFPASRWGGDADALLAPASTAPTAGGDGDLADIAVEALIGAPPERAIPLLKRVLESDRPFRTKQRALFVLGQLDHAEALDVVIASTRNADGELRREAIRMLGIAGDPRGIASLREVYAKSTDRRERHQVIEAWMIAGRKDLILDAARNEVDPELRIHAIQMLGSLGATAELRQMLDSTRDDKGRRAVLQGLGIAGSADALAAIAGDASQSERTRIDALHALGIAAHGDASRLSGIYAKADTPALREAALQGLLIAGDGKAVLELYRKAKDVEQKKALLRVLAMMDDDAALEAIESELER